MVKKKKLLSLIMVTALAMGTLAGCGGATKETASSNGGSKSLTVWSHLNSQEVEKVNQLAEKWGQEKNVTVKVIEDKSDMQSYAQVANSSKGPDIMFGLANDNLGTFQKAGLLAEVPNGFIDESKYTSKQVIDAVTIGGKEYGVPLAQETVALFYNKDKVKEVPKTMEELETKAKEVGFEFDVNNFYMDYGFLAAQGGYVFKNNNGTLDPKDIGLGNDGAVKGYQFIQDLVVKDKFMAPDINGDIAKGDFQSGKSAFYISGPWDVAAFKDAGLNFGVVPMPTFGGKPVQTFLGVQAAFVSEKSANKDLAWDLMKYLTENCNDILIQQGNRIPATKAGVESDTFKKADNMVPFSDQAKNATPMPNIPEVQAMWTPGADGLKALTSGTMDANAVAKQIAEQVKQGIEQQK
ncbi:maltose ABC transporter substrate-binding protein [Clostridium sp.]|uniref:sugar ABC transporter substrate-binding protein n=1 Tax=Clostridium sp. TaxID=1506 RepID=UPI00283B4154|nr:maltose ABC transporter substrate-binding protein [Clostridium sp.]MDR3595402.1 maltose ABC transporter substrate-binding protein [Clostridium sp.]